MDTRTATRETGLLSLAILAALAATAVIAGPRSSFCSRRS